MNKAKRLKNLAHKNRKNKKQMEKERKLRAAETLDQKLEKFDVVEMLVNLPIQEKMKIINALSEPTENFYEEEEQ